MPIIIAQIHVVAKDDREQASRQAREIGSVCRNPNCPRYGMPMWGNGGKNRGAMNKDGEGETVVWRLRCGNCNATVTILPAGLVPYSPFTVQTHQEMVITYATGAQTYAKVAEQNKMEGLLTASTIWNWTDSWVRQSEPLLGAMIQASSEFAQNIDITRHLTPSEEEIQAIAKKTKDQTKQQAFIYFSRLCWYTALIAGKIKQMAASFIMQPHNLLQLIQLRTRQYYIFQRTRAQSKKPPPSPAP